VNEAERALDELAALSEDVHLQRFIALIALHTKLA